MKTIKNVRFECWKRSEKEGGQPMVCLTAEAIDDEPSFHYITFYFEGDEFRGFCQQYNGTWPDIAHRVDTWGDMVTFYDIDVPRATSGTMAVRI